MATIAPIHPGEVLLEEFLEPLAVTQHRLGVSIGAPPSPIIEIVHSKRRISADTALRLARSALEAGGAAPIVLNAANEVAVAAFLAGSIGFGAIARLVEEALAHVECGVPHSIGDVLEIDRMTRAQAEAMMRAIPA